MSASCAANGSRLIATSTTLSPKRWQLSAGSVDLTKYRMLSFEACRKRMPRCVCSAGFSLRIWLSCVISLMMLPGRFQSQARISYFSESRYSSLPGIGVPSHSSKPLYMPHSPDSVVASAARIKKPGRPERCRKYGLMSGVVTKKRAKGGARAGGGRRGRGGGGRRRGGAPGGGGGRRRGAGRGGPGQRRRP